MAETVSAAKSWWLTGVVDIERCQPADIEALAAFLQKVDLTQSGLGAPRVRLWIERDEGGNDDDHGQRGNRDDRGAVVASTGYEISANGQHALIRSVAVTPSLRSCGRGSRLARFALDRAAMEGATMAGLFSRRSGPFWQNLGFKPASLEELAEALADTHQVRLFEQTGQLHREVAWSRALVGA